MRFGKIFLAALLAVLVSGILSTLFWLIVVASIGAMDSSASNTVEENTILKIDFTEMISDSPSNDPFSGIDLFSMDMNSSISLFDVLRAIDAAKSDEKIEGIYIRPLGAGTMGAAALEEIRAALLDFKQSGKFIVAYGEVFQQGHLYLASVADKIYLQPEGNISWQGMASTVPFFKGLFDKLGVEYEIFRPTSCKYKSAVEPYFLTEMSPANREQNQVMIDSMWEVIAGAVAEARGIEFEEFNRLTDALAFKLPEDALNHGMVDALIYEDEMEQLFEELGVERNAEEEFNFVSLGDYARQVMPDVENLTAPEVAIIYADGSIVDGEGDTADQIFGNSFAAEIAKLRKQEDVKAVVVRVNSPGGSALASDLIWREMKLLQAEKPIVISMGNYAASGGYYISAPADAILADRLTLTGSIGVFGAFPVVDELMEEKLGITLDGVKTNQSADFGQGFLIGMNRPCSPAEKAILIRSVDKVYENFTSKVAEGRNLPLERVLEIAEGRVWSGVDALEIGLIDGHGGLKEAIAVAADKAGLTDYRVEEHLPEPEGLAALFSSINLRLKAQYELDALGGALLPYKKAQEILNQQGILMYSPYLYSIF